MPATDVLACQSWTPQQLNLYNALPLWMIEREQQFRKKYGNWKQLFGNLKWEPNKGPLGRGVVTEPPPTLRQFAFPEALDSACATRDLIQFRERTFDIALYHHKFESPTFQWLPSFNDFVEKKLMKNLDFVMQWQEDYQAQYYRGFMFHQSPAVMFCDHKTLPIDDLAPVGNGNAAGTSGKSNAYIAGRVVDMLAPGNLSIKNIMFAYNYLNEDALAVPYQSGTAKDDSFMNDKYLLMTSNEAYAGLMNDPFLKEMKNCDMNVVTDGFKGSIGGVITSKLHSNPLRILRAADGTISFPAPESIQENPSASNYGQTVRNCDYRNAQFEVAFLCGAKGYSIVDVGAPPGDFTGAGPDRISRLQWNGRPRVTDRINIPCTDGSGGTFFEPNAYDEFLKIISYMVMGAAAETTRNVLPIIFKRSRGITTSIV